MPRDAANVAVLRDEMAKRMPMRHWAPGAVGIAGPAGQAVFRGALDAQPDNDADELMYGDDLAAMIGGTRKRGHLSSQAAANARRMRQKPLEETVDVDSPMHFTNVPCFIANYKDALQVSDPVSRIVRAVFLFARFNLPTIESMCRANYVSVPFNAAVFRLGDYRCMKGMIAMKGGEDTGITVWSRSNISIVNDGITKTSLVALTFWNKAIVKEDKYIQIFSNVDYDRYLGGHNSDFFTEEDHQQWRGRGFIPWNKDTGRSSLMAVALSPNEPTLDNRLDCRGHEIKFRTGTNYTNPQSEKLSYSTAKYYSDVYSFKEMQAPAVGTMFYHVSAKPNCIMYREHYREWSAPNCWDNAHENKGHHGPTYPGVASARNGGPGAFPMPNDPYRVGRVRA